MRQATHRLKVRSLGQGFVDLTPAVARWVEAQRMDTGLLTLFGRHTSASLLIQENADPTVRADLLRAFEGLAPEGPGRYAHEDEGPDDMPAHLRTALTSVSLGVPLLGGRLALGTWQAIYLFEHRRRPHEREVVLHLLGA